MRTWQRCATALRWFEARWKRRCLMVTQPTTTSTAALHDIRLTTTTALESSYDLDSRPLSMAFACCYGIVTCGKPCLDALSFIWISHVITSSTWLSTQLLHMSVSASIRTYIHSYFCPLLRNFGILVDRCPFDVFYEKFERVQNFQIAWYSVSKLRNCQFSKCISWGYWLDSWAEYRLRIYRLI